MQTNDRSDLESLKSSMLLPNPFESNKSVQESQQWEMIKSPLLQTSTDRGEEVPFKEDLVEKDLDKYENLLIDKINSNRMEESRYDIQMNKTLLN